MKLVTVFTLAALSLAAQFQPPPGTGGGGSGTVTSVTVGGTSGQIATSGTCTGTVTVNCTLAFPAAVSITSGLSVGGYPIGSNTFLCGNATPTTGVGICAFQDGAGQGSTPVFQVKNASGTTNISGSGNGVLSVGGLGFVELGTLSDVSNSKGYIETTASGVAFHLVNRATNNVAFSIQPATLQTANLLDLLNSSGARVAYFDVNANYFGISATLSGYGKAVHYNGNGASPTVAAGGAITTTPTISGTDFVGTVSVPSTAVTTGTIATVTFGTAWLTVAPNCWVAQNGGLVSVGVGHGTPGLTTFTLTAAIANVSAAAYLFDYGCSSSGT